MLLYVTVLTSHYFKLSISISLLNFDFLKVAKTLITDFVVNRFARNFANFYLKLLQTHLSRESFNFCRKKKFNFSFYNSAKAKLFFSTFTTKSLSEHLHNALTTNYAKFHRNLSKNVAVKPVSALFLFITISLSIFSYFSSRKNFNN